MSGPAVEEHMDVGAILMVHCAGLEQNKISQPDKDHCVNLLIHLHMSLFPHLEKR